MASKLVRKTNKEEEGKTKKVIDFTMNYDDDYQGDRGCFASLDGDADRIVFFGAEHGLSLCDGDKIGATSNSKQFLLSMVVFK